MSHRTQSKMLGLYRSMGIEASPGTTSATAVTSRHVTNRGERDGGIFADNKERQLLAGVVVPIEQILMWRMNSRVVIAGVRTKFLHKTDKLEIT
jgi:hypothetical protein